MTRTISASPTLAETRAALQAKLTEVEKAIGATEDELADQSLDQELAVGDAKANAAAKVRATLAKLQALRDDRDATAGAITKAEQRQAAATKQAAEEAKQKLIKEDEKLVAGRAAVFDSIATTIATFAALTVKAVTFDRKIDLVRQQIDPSLKENPRRQSVARILDSLNTVMCEAGFDRDWSWPHPSRRVRSPADWK